MTRDWAKDCRKFEDFLKSIDIRKYSHLRSIKTVEQDLPKELLPLDLYYKHYWDTTDFKDYEEIFEEYWNERLSPHIYNFIKKFFYGCSLQFVEEGFKARLYRIWVSILTQFHFQYLWNSLFPEKLYSSHKLDMMGIDAVLELQNFRVGVQVKKVSYRREASSRRFTRRQQAHADIMVEVPYLVIDRDELLSRINSKRVKDENREKYKRLLELFDKNFTRLDNGFVIFRGSYLENIRDILVRRLKSSDKGSTVTYEEILGEM